MTETAQQIVLDLVKAELNQFRPAQIEKVLQLLEEGNTVPFIARYRKEVTGSLDEVEIRQIEERHQYATNLHKRKEEVIRIIEEQGKLTPKLKADIERAEKMQRVEDLYRPYKQKRRTKAAIAREKGLAPFAEWLLNGPMNGSVEAKAKEYLNEEMELSTIEDVLAGAHEIIAEIISDEPAYREHIREFTRKNGQIVSTAKDTDKDEKGVYEMYYEFSQGISSLVSHRVLAMNRGEKTGILKVAVLIDEDKIFAYLAKKVVKNPKSIAVPYLQAAYEDSYRRFIGPAIERELRNELTEAADAQAIDVFGDNLRNLLLQPPLKGKVVLGLDPAYRTGCKLAIVDATGKVLAKSVIYPHKPANQEKRAAAGPAFRKMLSDYKVEMVAIGNGTASRESELFVSDQIKQVAETVYYVIVNEAGASVYSASDIAREEFPDFQVEERSAVSIARRLQDPLGRIGQDRSEIGRRRPVPA